MEHQTLGWRVICPREPTYYILDCQILDVSQSFGINSSSESKHLVFLRCPCHFVVFSLKYGHQYNIKMDIFRLSRTNFVCSWKGVQIQKKVSCLNISWQFDMRSPRPLHVHSYFRSWSVRVRLGDPLWSESPNFVQKYDTIY